MAIEQNQPIYKQEPPSFNCSMDISYLEKIGACTNEIAANPEDTLDSIIDCFTKNKEEEREIIQNTGDEIGPGRGFTGDELLSKDELNLILDLEDESMRTGQFDRIFPCQPPRIGTTASSKTSGTRMLCTARGCQQARRQRQHC